MEKKQDGGPAFPASTRPMQDEYGYGHQDGHSTWQYGGMTLRDYFAAEALKPVYADAMAESREGSRLFQDPDWRFGIALDAYKMADAMLRAREAV